MRFIMLGGFLGAGKTTGLARLARHYMRQGLRVGIVTNDQAYDLVDTRNLRAQGFAVQEVPGACFCCRFDELVSTVKQHEESEQPDVILAEPVGSCTDLVATVVQPLKHLYGKKFQVAPYVVLFKPSHGLRILGGGEGGFSSKAAYIFRKQLEEADAIGLNRIDEMKPEEVETLSDLVTRHFPDTPLLRLSAATGAGFDDLVNLLNQEGEFGRRILDIDYDVYAEGEAELGWLNSSAVVTAEQPFALDDFLLGLARRMGERLREQGAEVAHLKAIGLADTSFGTVNVVSSQSAAELSLPSHARVSHADIIINARVAMDPLELEKEARSALKAEADKWAASVQFRSAQSFRPARPKPTHRYSTAP
jgi:G3E family GTPase